jgi:hypothetical protein
MKRLIEQSAGDFLTCSLGNEGGARESACRRSCIDLVDKRFIERNVNSYGSTSICKQWNGKQNSSSFERYFYFSITQNIINTTCWRQSLACAFKGFRMLPQSNGRIPNSLFQCVTRRKTSLHVRKPDAEGAVSVLFHNSHVTRRHSFQISSRTPAGQFVDVADQPNRQISPWMCHRVDNYE